MSDKEIDSTRWYVAPLEHLQADSLIPPYPKVSEDDLIHAKHGDENAWGDSHFQMVHGEYVEIPDGRLVQVVREVETPPDPDGETK